MAGDDEGCQFEPDIGIFGDAADGIEDRREVGLAEVHVIFLGECFEVYVDCVEEVGGEVDGFGGHVAVAYEDVGQAVLFGETAGVCAEFHEDGWFGVGVGDG